MTITSHLTISSRNSTDSWQRALNANARKAAASSGTTARRSYVHAHRFGAATSLAEVDWVSWSSRWLPGSVRLDIVCFSEDLVGTGDPTQGRAREA